MTFPKRRKRSRMNVREDGPLRCPGHLQWVRGHECIACSTSQNIVAAHVRMGLAGGMGQKPPDDRAVPLCWDCHEEQHQQGENNFWGILGLDPVAIAERLANASPPLRKLRMKERNDT